MSIKLKKSQNLMLPTNKSKISSTKSAHAAKGNNLHQLHQRHTKFNQAKDKELKHYCAHKILKKPRESINIQRILMRSEQHFIANFKKQGSDLLADRI